MNRRALLGAIGAGLVSLGGLVLLSKNAKPPHPHPTPMPNPTPTPAPVPTPLPNSGIYHGVWQPGVPQNFSALDTFESQAGKKAAIIAFWRDYAADAGTLDVNWLNTIASRNAMPHITLSPANWSGDNTPYTLENIAAGMFDSFLTGFAKTCAAFGKPIQIRQMHEFNGNWYTHWSGRPTQYIAAWRHIVDLFRANAATNVLWVWCPNVYWAGSLSTDPLPYWPGDTYVDWIGLDGYVDQRWYAPMLPTFYQYAYDHLTAFSTKPLVICEYAMGETGDDGTQKAAMIIRTLTQDILAMPRFKAVIYFNEDKTTSEGPWYSWPINTTAKAQAAYKSSIGNALYLGSWP